jgi:apolipoprotein N-acyltransferase
LPGHSLQLESTLLPALQAAALEQDSALLAGLVYAQADQQRFYNSVMQFGRQQGLYHKRHLVVFGEYYPMRWLLNLFSGLINIPYSDLSSGPDEQPLMQVGDYRLGVSICWEDVFSRDILLSLPQANLLVNVSNDAWFGDSTAPHQHVQIAQMRSLETERVMMRATNTGITAFIDHKGRVLSASEQFRSESISAVLHGRSGVTPFYYFARVQWLFALLPATLLLLGIRRKGR